MFIRCWGSRGSIPVSGKQYNKYGGDTTCVEIRTKNDDIIIIDAGTGIRRLGNQLIEEKRRQINFIFTHSHWDHVMGFPFFKPIYNNQSEFRMHRCPFAGYVEKMLSTVMTPPNFPVRYSDLKAKIYYEPNCAKDFKIGTVTVVPIALSHPNTGSGYKFIEDGKTFVFLTDNELGFVHPGGLSYDAYVEFAKGADLLIHDAEYTPDEYPMFYEWGHSSYDQTLDLAFEAGVKELGLFHLNQERTDRQVDQIVKECRKIITKRKETLNCFAVAADRTFVL